MMGYDKTSGLSASDLRPLISKAQSLDETDAIQDLLRSFPISTSERKTVKLQAEQIVTASRAMRSEQGTLDAFLAQFGLSNQEGVALMCLAEALLRVPDAVTKDDLIAEKILSGNWQSHLGQSDNPFVNASTWALMLTGRVVALDDDITVKPQSWISKLVNRSGEPVIRQAVGQAMKIMGRQFVYGRSIEDGLKRQRKEVPERRMMSFDMLGEGARTAADAARYFELYRDALAKVGKASKNDGADVHARSSISIKLSALHPRYDDIRRERVAAEILPWLKTLALDAKAHDIQLTIDAEEADRLDLQLDMIDALARDPDFAGWDGLGLAVQAYQKRAPIVIDWLIATAREAGRVLAVRLVKGAYWDTEIKHAHVMGLDDFPVWTRKASTDIGYLASAARMLEASDVIYPQFATHNAHTIAAIQYLGKGKRFEFQKLHGMGTLLYKAAGEVTGAAITTRTYAPVGQHEDLLPYLVRRLLENGANSSFVNRFMDASVPVSDVASDPVDVLAAANGLRHPGIHLPVDMFGAERANSAGINLMNRVERENLTARLQEMSPRSIDGTSLVSGQAVGTAPQDVFSPQDQTVRVGTIRNAGAEDRETAIQAARAHWKTWDSLGGIKRAAILRACGDALEAQMADFTDLMMREAGKTAQDCIDEVREAVDFCRFYANEAAEKCAGPEALPGPTGESNTLTLGGRGVFLAISPWNFPLAIFTGQIMAALAAGNAVIAKPAEQTPLTAFMAVQAFHAAGVPAHVLHLLAGGGADVAGPLVADERVNGVVFTGSTATAKVINRALAARDGAIVPLIAETGGQNAMIVDSTALPEQVTDDVIRSAFGSAGQRCSALRVLYVQDSIADKLLTMLKGALKEQKLGDPTDLTTDIGPIIDAASRDRLQAHCAALEAKGQLIAKMDTPPGLERGTFLAPHIFGIDRLSDLPEEKFGPILHVIRFKTDEISQILEDIEQSGYGLTFGVHSRLEHRWQRLFEGTRAGNVYINRNITGAVVGVQPFGGEGLSGTGPKAGGPHYVARFAVERTLTINTAAVGGNAELFALAEG